MASSSSAAATSGGGGALEWLSGGLFGRGKAGSGIESSTDISALVSGISEDLGLITGGGSSAKKKDGTAAGSAAAAATPPDNKGEAASSSDQPSGDPECAANAVVVEESRTNLAGRLNRIKYLLYNERTSLSPSTKASPPNAETLCQSLTTESPNLLHNLFVNLALLPFESRKDIASIFNYLLVCGLDANEGVPYTDVMATFERYIDAHYEDILTPIIRGHDCGNCSPSTAVTNAGGGTATSIAVPSVSRPANRSSPDVALHCGSMLRSTLRHPGLYQRLVSDEYAPIFVYPFLDKYVHLPNFDVASDALETVRIIFTGGGGGACAEGDNVAEGIAATFLEKHYEPLLEERFNAKCLSSKANYMTRRMSLQLLSTVLLTRSNYNVMMRYISSRTNLVLVMCLLRDPSPHITLDAFHVLKIFVANPTKPKDVVKILVDNKVKLAKYLETLHQDREAADEQFRDEKALVIATLEGLEMI